MHFFYSSFHLFSILRAKYVFDLIAEHTRYVPGISKEMLHVSSKGKYLVQLPIPSSKWLGQCLGPSPNYFTLSSMHKIDGIILNNFEESFLFIHDGTVPMYIEVFQAFFNLTVSSNSHKLKIWGPAFYLETTHTHIYKLNTLNIQVYKQTTHTYI